MVAPSAEFDEVHIGTFAQGFEFGDHCGAALIRQCQPPSTVSQTPRGCIVVDTPHDTLRSAVASGAKIHGRLIQWNV
jgi:hypothetical protein